MASEYKIADGLYFTDFRKNPSNENNLQDQNSALSCQANSYINPKDLMGIINNTADPSQLGYILDDQKQKVKGLLESNQFIMNEAEFSKDTDLIEALVENFEILDKYFNYIQVIKTKLEVFEAKEAFYNETEFDDLISQFGKQNIHYKESKQQNDQSQMICENIDNNQQEKQGLFI